MSNTTDILRHLPSIRQPGHDLSGMRNAMINVADAIKAANENVHAQNKFNGLRQIRQFCGDRFPLNPLPGDECYRTDDQFKYFWDQHREKWLSTTLFPVYMGRSTTIGVGQYLKLAGNFTPGGASWGPYVPWNITIIGWTLSVTVTAGGDTLAVRRNAVTKLGIPVPNAPDESRDLDVNVNIGGLGFLDAIKSAGGATLSRAFLTLLTRRNKTGL